MGGRGDAPKGTDARRGEERGPLPPPALFGCSKIVALHAQLPAALLAKDSCVSGVRILSLSAEVMRIDNASKPQSCFSAYFVKKWVEGTGAASPHSPMPAVQREGPPMSN